MTEDEKIKKLNELITEEANTTNPVERERIQLEYASLLKTTKLWKTFAKGK